jgi:hypothetical protein
MQSMRFKDESTSTEGPLISAVVIIWLTSSANSRLDMISDCIIDSSSAQAARQVPGRLTDRMASCQTCCQCPDRDSSCEHLDFVKLCGFR